MTNQLWMEGVGGEGTQPAADTGVGVVIAQPAIGCVIGTAMPVGSRDMGSALPVAGRCDCTTMRSRSAAGLG